MDHTRFPFIFEDTKSFWYKYCSCFGFSFKQFDKYCCAPFKLSFNEIKKYSPRNGSINGLLFKSHGNSLSVEDIGNLSLK